MPLVSVKHVEAVTKTGAAHLRRTLAATLRRAARLTQGPFHGTTLAHPS